jgi:dinuclear metal center YbgI/SA1388 family protein
MVARDELIGYLDDYLRLREFRDYGPQGLQVEGRTEIRKVVTAVSSSRELFERAAKIGADLILVHHGLLWDRDSRLVRGAYRERLATLLRHEINLAAYHLCLDAHPEVGNNALAARGLGLTERQPWCEEGGVPIGFRGCCEPAPAEEWLRRIDQFYGSRSLAFLEGPEQVRTIGIVSGGAQRQVQDAIAAGLDMYVTGEVSEFVMHTAKEGRIHFVAAGHYNTERIGIRALGEHVASRFGVEVEFIDLPNPA